MAGKKKRKKRGGLLLFLKVQLVLVLLLAVGAAWYVFGGYANKIKSMQESAKHVVAIAGKEIFRDNQTSIVYTADGSVLSTLKSAGESYYLAREHIPADAVKAITSIEDKKFFQHDGVDYLAILRAVKVMIENGEATQGASTITMQLARTMFLSQEKTFQRKLEEIFIAWELEKRYTKDEILEFYLNNIYFGNGYYGLQSASRGYFSKDAGELGLSELAFLCAIPNNPTLYDPCTNMNNALGRRERILRQMQEDGKISEDTYRTTVSEPIVLQRPEAAKKNDYLETYTYYCATRALMEKEKFVFRYQFNSAEEEERYDAAYDELYASCQKKLYTKGYQIYTSLDPLMQTELQSAVDGTLKDFTTVNWEGVYELQASAVCIDNDNGYVKAIVGGRSQEFAGYTLNRAYQSYRQPGSSVKPLTVYTPVFERGYTPESLVVDEPIEDGPKNVNGVYRGEVTLRVAVEKSINTVAWNLYEELTPQVGLSYLEAMNFAKLEREDYSLATSLGGFTKGVSSLEMAAGYAALENDGKYRMPTCIVKILDADGNEVYVSAQEEKPIYRENAARMMTDTLKGVLTAGTGEGLGLSRMPCAGKTGTTNDYKDGWFVGYTRYYTTSVWVGYDMPRRMDGLMGNTYPGKIWKQFMESIHMGLPTLDFLSYANREELPGTEDLLETEAGEENQEDAKLPEDIPQWEDDIITPEGGWSWEQETAPEGEAGTETLPEGEAGAQTVLEEEGTVGAEGVETPEDAPQWEDDMGSPEGAPQWEDDIVTPEGGWSWEQETVPEETGTEIVPE